MLHRHGLPNKKKQEIVGISLATYYCWKKWLKCPIFRSKHPKNVRQSKFGVKVYELIRRIREKNKTYGKAKICVILRHDFGVNISKRSTGRIMKKLRFPRSRSALRYKKKREFDKYTKPFKFKKYGEMEIGENVQIDHMTATKHGVVMKHFARIERRSEHVYANVYCKANSANATKFLRELIENVPYKVRSIQVDGGSEFIKDFEDVCKELGILLFVLSRQNQRITARLNEVTGFSEKNFTPTLLKPPFSEPAETS